ncbi:MAG: hypothetical protein OEZ06_08450 [Myxococcales bacterium]|nr:hypothetical protein [Myxococcales bacterium]
MRIGLILALLLTLGLCAPKALRAQSPEAEVGGEAAAAPATPEAAADAAPGGPVEDAEPGPAPEPEVAPAAQDQAAPDSGAGVVADTALSAGTDIEAAAETDGPVIELAEEDLPGQQAAPGAAPSAAGGSTDPQDPKSGDLIERVSSSGSGVTLGGYGQHELKGGESETLRFRNHRYVIFVFGRISDRLTTTTEIEFEWAGSPLKRDGTLGPGEVLLEFSVLDFKLAEWLVLRAGVILSPVSSFNINHDAPTRDLVDRPIAYTSVVPSTWYESGAGLYGKFALSDEQQLGYEIYVINGLDARIYDGIGLRGARGSHFEDNNDDKAVIGRVAYKPTLDTEFGLSGYTGAYDQRQNRILMGNLDFKIRAGDLELLGEAVYVDIDDGFVEGFSASSPANTRDAVPTGMWGYFGQINYHFRIEPLFRHLPAELDSAVLTAVARYEAKDTDVNFNSTLGDQRRLTLGLNFRPIEQVVFKNDLQWNTRGLDGQHDAADLWQGRFWDGRKGGVLFDAFAFSAAYLF